MISSDKVRQTVASYAKACSMSARSPTRQALAKRLGVSPRTIGRAIDGLYAEGHPYTDHPAAIRRIDNSDFETIRALFT